MSGTGSYVIPPTGCDPYLNKTQYFQGISQGSASYLSIQETVNLAGAQASLAANSAAAANQAATNANLATAQAITAAQNTITTVNSLNANASMFANIALAAALVANSAMHNAVSNAAAASTAATNAQTYSVSAAASATTATSAASTASAAANTAALYAGNLTNAVQTTGSNLTGALNWLYTINSQANERFVENIAVIDNHNNNALTQGGSYVSLNGIDTVNQITCTINGNPANGRWVNSEVLYLAGDGAGASVGQTHVSRYITAYRTNLPYAQTTVTSSTPGAPVLSLTVANVVGFGLGYPSASNAPDGGVGGGAYPVSTSVPLAVQGASGAVYNVVGCVGQAVDPVKGAIGTGTLTFSSSTPVSVADATHGAVLTNMFVGSNAYRSQGAALLPFVVEMRDKTGKDSGIAGALEGIEIDVSACGPDSAGERKAMGAFFQVESGSGQLAAAASSGATSISVTIPTWYSYYPLLSTPTVGFFIFGTGFATNCTITAVTFTGQTGTFGQAFGYLNYTITLSAALTSNLSSGAGFKMAPYLTATFANEKQTLIDTGATINYVQQYYGGGTIGYSLIDTTLTNFAANAAAVRLNNTQNLVAWGTPTNNAATTYLTANAVQNSLAPLMEVTRNGYTGIIDFGPGMGNQIIISANTTLNANSFGTTYICQGNSAYTILLPSALTVPNGRGFEFKSEAGNGVRINILTQLSQVLFVPNQFTGQISLFPYDHFTILSDGLNWRLHGGRNNASGCGYWDNTVNLIASQGTGGLAGGDIGRDGFASDGRNTGESAGAGSGCPVFAKYLSNVNQVWWCAVYNAAPIQR